MRTNDLQVYEYIFKVMWNQYNKKITILRGSSNELYRPDDTLYGVHWNCRAMDRWYVRTDSGELDVEWQVEYWRQARKFFPKFTAIVGSNVEEAVGTLPRFVSVMDKGGHSFDDSLGSHTHEEPGGEIDWDAKCT